ncbi:MAG: hypothetical protein ACJAWS_002868 [Oleiphilaceae bacterium]|jgi:hypothetical protein
MMQLRQLHYPVGITKRLHLRILIGCIILLTSLNGFAEDEILSLDGARIRGNQELPNVLYLIPWKTPKVHSLDPADNSLSTRPKLKTLDRSSFKRLVNYHQAFKNKADDSKN